jgi:hypothetical protein
MLKFVSNQLLKVTTEIDDYHLSKLVWIRNNWWILSKGEHVGPVQIKRNKKVRSRSNNSR